jgi:hypothetical protein
MKPPALPIAAIVACSSICSLAAKPPATIDIASLPASLVDEVVIPVPREVFLSLDKLGDQDWGSQIMASDFDKLGDREQVALLFGVVVADGFVAVQAENRDAVTDIGRHVSRLAKALGVSDAVTAHAAAIIDSAEKDDWDGVRAELDRVQESVRETMRASRDENLAQMVSTGGWLRGTEATAALVKGSYSKERAEILHQPDLAKHIAAQLGKDSKSKLGSSLAEGLGKISPLLALEGESLPEDAVAKIHTVTAGLVRQIVENSK